MSLNEIKSPDAKNNPINTFYVYSIDSKSSSISNLVTDSITSNAGSDLKIQPGSPNTNVVAITSGSFSGLGVNNRGVVNLDGTGKLQATTLSDGQVLIGQTGSLPVPGTITAGQGTVVTNAAGSITIAKLPVLAITTTGSTAIQSSDTKFVNITFIDPQTVYDPYGFRSGNADFIVPAGAQGIYQITCGLRFQDNKTGDVRGLSIAVGDANLNPMAFSTVDTIGTGRSSCSLSFTYQLNVGNIVNVRALQNIPPLIPPGTTLDVTSAELFMQCLVLN